jgi:COP9 signalosome complex subunit 3
MYDVALRVLDQPCYEINKDSDMGALDFLLFHYYGGMIFIGLKQLERALEFFQMALVVESQVISAVQVAAYKKYVLCSLLVHGDVAEIPEKMSPSVAFVQRTCRRICQGYHDLARAYQKGPEALQKLIVEIAEELHKDQNFGLAKQIVKALVRRNIQRLTNTYVTLALGDIASRAKLQSAAEAEEYVLRMIEDGSIHARIDQKKGMISFLEESEEFDSTPQAQALDRKLKEVIALSEQIKKKQREVELTPQYVSIVMPPERDERDLLGRGGGDMGMDPMLARAIADSMRG